MSEVFRGSRKFASASFVPAETGELLINGQKPEEYFREATWGNALAIVRQLEQELNCKIPVLGRIKVQGGGKVSQIASVRLAVHRYIATKHTEAKQKLRSLGELTFDTRRKATYRLGKARKSPQRNKR